MRYSLPIKHNNQNSGDNKTMPQSTQSILQNAMGNTAQRKQAAIDIGLQQDPNDFNTLGDLAEKDSDEGVKIQAIHSMTQIMMAQNNYRLFDKKFLSIYENPTTPNTFKVRETLLDCINDMAMVVHAKKPPYSNDFKEIDPFFSRLMHFCASTATETNELIREKSFKYMDSILQYKHSHNHFEFIAKIAVQNDPSHLVRKQASNVLNRLHANAQTLAIQGSQIIIPATSNRKAPTSQNSGTNTANAAPNHQQNQTPSVIEIFTNQNINFRIDENLDPQKILTKSEHTVVAEFEDALRKQNPNDKKAHKPLKITGELNGQNVTVYFMNATNKTKHGNIDTVAQIGYNLLDTSQGMVADTLKKMSDGTYVAENLHMT